MKYLLVFIVFIFLISGCEKQTNWELQNKSRSLIVVDGMITDEMKKQSIKITWPVSELNDIPSPVNGAVVSISNGDTVVSLFENPAGSGIYQTNLNYAATAGTAYTLDITYNSKHYTAIADMRKNSYFKILKYGKVSNSDKYKIDWVANTYNADIAAMYEIQLDWSSVPAYQNKPQAECKATLFFYTLPTIDVSEIFSPEFEKVTFPAGTKISEKRFAISRQHAEFIRALLSETNWSGGYFDSAPANVPTNLSEGAVGFFSACPVMIASMIVTAH